MSSQTQKRQASMALELFNRVVAHGDLNHMSELAVNLWNMVQKHGQLDHRLMVSKLVEMYTAAPIISGHPLSCVNQPA